MTHLVTPVTGSVTFDTGHAVNIGAIPGAADAQTEGQGCSISF
ncbi:hypothetical protein LPE509_01213 [Legionella pneumophila subsp. pneumophila LPE509]|nr:hypothetical protein LPE509_01213 [Legionella pneumophila subsp. pneumophila LPE509]